MFALAMDAKKRDMGVVGSTQNILDFIAAKLTEAVERPFPDTLQVCPKLQGSVVHDSPKCKFNSGWSACFCNNSTAEILVPRITS